MREGIPIQTLLWRTFTPAIVVIAIALGALVYSRLYDTILDGFSRKLVTTSALTGALIDPADHDWLIAQAVKPDADPEALEATPQYRRNVEPLRRIRRELGLTYLYSQVLGGPKDVFYVLDGTEGEEHSSIGAADELPAATRTGLRRAQTDGTIYISPIEFQEQWGLLKTAAAPMRGADGAITATAGADVNISVIQVATQNALFVSAMIGAASLLASALMTIWIVRWVAQPIEGLKGDALRIAVGDRAPPTALKAPREVARLREALADLAAHLTGSMRAAWTETLAHDRARNHETLAAALDGEGEVALADDGARRVIWAPPPHAGPEAALERAAMVDLAARFAADPELTAGWRGLALAEHGAVLAVDRKSGRAERASGSADAAAAWEAGA
ncbi:MAG: HAMP domain-containing protein [Phenylobacterium sp.]|uniref:hypothetical protein n=1 Tax=Phenylobacterium sp. TaxID=1871053 RepID=UPI0025E7C26A|nr:hypothetical protein [Phenylobacterium sp.]MBI1200395.1 HAMP domain-containing protein [Phenylobacterium sp.]